jgi:peptidoglycan DL-endopeptidase CwlO
LIQSALELTTRNLTYQFGSADPANGGMDCSGFIYYVLSKHGIENVPRTASEQYAWLRKLDRFKAVLSRNSATFELDALQPGDLLFWTGTYHSQRDPPVTHTMIYLGREKKNGHRVMAGASDGRTYEGKSRWGVSVFDFKGAGTVRPDSESRVSPRFAGYASLPGIRD